MTESERTRFSKFLSFVLRHRPEHIGLSLDRHGWADVDDLVARCREHGVLLTREQLEDVVATNPKQRFAFSDDGSRIRANQGHTIDVDLGYDPAPPPELLYHGTGRASLDSIRASGLQRRRRHHVHLSPDAETAIRVGKRRGEPIVLVVRAGDMHRAGHVFYRSANDVWLTDAVPPTYITFPGDE